MKRLQPVFAMLVVAGVVACATPAADPAVTAVAAQYYAGIAGELDVDAIPMAPDLRFRGPGRSADDAASFRAALRGLTPQVRSLAVRRQLVGDDAVLTFYDLDLGAFGEPVAYLPYLGENPHVVRIAPDGRTAVVANYVGDVVEDLASSTLVIIDIDPTSDTYLEPLTWIGNL